MLMEARGKGVVPPSGRLRALQMNEAKWLKRNPKTIQALNDYWVRVDAILRLNLLLLDENEQTFRNAQQARDDYGLLTSDSLIASTIDFYGIDKLVSRDSDFDRLTSITRYCPTDYAP